MGRIVLFYISKCHRDFEFATWDHVLNMDAAMTGAAEEQTMWYGDVHVEEDRARTRMWPWRLTATLLRWIANTMSLPTCPSGAITSDNRRETDCQGKGADECASSSDRSCLRYLLQDIHVHVHVHECAITTVHTVYSSYVTLIIGVHEMHGRMHPN